MIFAWLGSAAKVGEKGHGLQRGAGEDPGRVAGCLQLWCC